MEIYDNSGRRWRNPVRRARPQRRCTGPHVRVCPDPVLRTPSRRTPDATFGPLVQAPENSPDVMVAPGDEAGGNLLLTLGKDGAARRARTRPEARGRGSATTIHAGVPPLTPGTVPSGQPCASWSRSAPSDEIDCGMGCDPDPATAPTTQHDQRPVRVVRRNPLHSEGIAMI